jgi:hypothetical protein
MPPEMAKRLRDAYSRLLERDETEGLKSEKRSKISDFYRVMEGVKNCGWHGWCRWCVVA